MYSPYICFFFCDSREQAPHTLSGKRAVAAKKSGPARARKGKRKEDTGDDPPEPVRKRVKKEVASSESGTQPLVSVVRRKKGRSNSSPPKSVGSAPSSPVMPDCEPGTSASAPDTPPFQPQDVPDRTQGEMRIIV